MISITVNGQSKSVADESTVADILRSEGLDADEARGIAVALNDEIVRRAVWQTTDVGHDDRIEIVTARQGG